MFNLLLFTILQVNVISSSKTAPTWTVLYYICGDNDLQGRTKEYCDSIISNMNSVGKPYPVNVAIEIDAFDDSIPTRKYFFFGDSSVEESIDSETDMSDENELINFSREAVEKMGSTPKYALMICSHGCNWKGIVQDQHPFDWMGIPNGRFQKGLDGVKKVIGQNINVLELLACQMQAWEVLVELQGKVDLTVGNWRSTKISDPDYLTDLLHNANWPQESLALAIAKTEEAFSAIRTSGIPKLTQDINSLALILKSAPDSVKKRIIDDAIIISHFGPETRRVSLGAFVVELKNDYFLNDLIRTIATNIKNDIVEMTIYPDSSSTVYLDSTGLERIISIYFPQIVRNYEADYDKLTSSAITNWDEYLNSNDFPYYWCYSWDSDFIWNPGNWKGGGSTEPDPDITGEKKFLFVGRGMKQVRIRFAYLDLSEGDTLFVYDDNVTYEYTGKSGEFFTPILRADFTVKFRGHLPIPRDCFYLCGIAWTEDENSAGVTEKELVKTLDITAWPNPFQKFLHIKANTASEVAIYDVTGRLVKKLLLEGESICWDGKDVSGKTVNSGIYFLKIGNKSPKKIIKLVN